jgi:hypothetical protein
VPSFASAAFPRPQVNIEKEDLISAAVKQWLRFDGGNKTVNLVVALPKHFVLNSF